MCILESEVRYSVLVSLDEKFDPHLAQAESLAALFIALNDEVFEIRELAICIIGRLCSLNPAHVMPFLRKMLIEVFSDFLVNYFSHPIILLACFLRAGFTNDS